MERNLACSICMPVVTGLPVFGQRIMSSPITHSAECMHAVKMRDVDESRLKAGAAWLRGWTRGPVYAYEKVRSREGDGLPITGCSIRLLKQQLRCHTPDFLGIITGASGSTPMHLDALQHVIGIAARVSSKNGTCRNMDCF